MDGTVALIAEICDLADEFNCLMFIDGFLMLHHFKHFWKMCSWLNTSWQGWYLSEIILHDDIWEFDQFILTKSEASISTGFVSIIFVDGDTK